MALPDFSVGDRYDVDRLLAGYRTARAQEALFDLRDGPGGGSYLRFFSSFLSLSLSPWRMFDGAGPMVASE